jgi:hypothetical protein
MTEKLTGQQLKEAIALYEHLLNHKEVQQSKIHKGVPVCKICGMSAKEILRVQKVVF